MSNYGLADGQHIPGTVVHTYLHDFAEHFDLTRRIRLHTSVRDAEYLGPKGWRLRIETPAGGQLNVHAARLVVATGLNSEPMLPALAGVREFGKPLLHTKDWAARAAELESTKTVAVVGGSKSAMDVANACASRGAKVHWIIRKSGFGPGWTSPTRVTPLKIRLDKLTTARFLTVFSPCIWAVGFPRFRRFLQATWFGRQVVKKWYADMEKDMLEIIGYDKHPETAKLKPWTSIFWHGADVSVLNYDKDMLEMVREGQVEVHMADIDRLEPGTILLSDGTSVSTEVLFCATGWSFKPPLHFSGVTDEELGLPLEKSSNPDLVERVDAEISQNYPILRDPPPRKADAAPLPGTTSAPKEPYRLYRFTVPPRMVPTRNLAYAGATHNITTCLTAQLQALWITAYFDDQLAATHLPEEDSARIRTLEKIEYEAFLHTQFSKRRTPYAFGARHPDFSTDSLAFMDRLQDDLGLNIWRKKNFFWELFEAYGAQDYMGLVPEWLSKNGRVKRQ